ncbi:MAG: hypothetical protein II984_02820 [Clostridia bacterium]|nr:hypothetical protein [Clostridia bacterium]
MTEFKKYFSYIFKSSYKRLLIVEVLCVAITVVGVHCNPNGTKYFRVKFDVLSDILGALCFFTPIFELSQFKTRKSSDAIMFLPISKRKMSIAHYLNGLTQIIGIHTVCVIATFFKLIPHREHISIGYLFAYFGLSTVFAILIYSIFMFAFNEANTIADGVIFELLYMFLPCLISMGILDFLPVNDVFAMSFVTNESLNVLTYNFEDLVENSWVNFTVSDNLGFLVTLLFGALATFGYFYAFTRKKADNVESHSSSIFGYKTIIPIYGYCLLMFSYSLDDPFTILTFIAMFCGYMIYRRTFRIKKKDIIFIIAGVIPIIISTLFL